MSIKVKYLEHSCPISRCFTDFVTIVTQSPDLPVSERFYAIFPSCYVIPFGNNGSLFAGSEIRQAQHRTANNQK